MSDYFRRLPDELLTNILKRLPLYDKISLEAVSVRWQTVLHNHVLPSIKSLTLYQRSFAWKHRDIYQLMFFEPLHYSPYYDHNSMPISAPSLDRSVCETLVRKMPNIIKLALYCIRIEIVDFSEVIFPKWSHLETLTFVPVFEDNFLKRYDYTDLQVAIEDSNLTNLKHLTLFGPLLEFDYENYELETLCLESLYDDDDEFEFDAFTKELFENVAPNLRALSLCNFNLNLSNLFRIDSVLNGNQELANKISTNLTHLTLQGIAEYDRYNDKVYDDRRLLGFIGRRFQSLTHLDVALNLATELPKVVELLSPLTQLTNLRLTENCVDEDNRPRFKPYANLFTGKFDGKVSSVKILHLKVPYSPKSSFYSEILPQAFPHLTELRYEGKGKLCHCGCRKSDKRDYRNVDALLYGEYRCKQCADDIWHSLVKRNLSLKFVYRNSRVVFDRTRDAEHSDGFKLRLELIGQSKYRTEGI